ncbi:MAG: flagellar hook-basal body complex protein FliE [bacterium]|nr:flagellar hook-basal body complex protein FliE [bacterium]
MPITSVISSTLQGAGREQSFSRMESGMPKMLEVVPPGGTPKIEPAGQELKPEFLDLVKGFVSDVNGLQIQSGKTVEAFVAGEITDVHQVMVAAQEAGLALDLLLEIRNRTTEAFQEIMRIQV